MIEYNGVEIKYSILLAGHCLDEAKIELLLHEGIKILLFGDVAYLERIGTAYKKFTEDFFLCLYENPNNVNVCIIDGKEAKENLDKLEELESGAPLFNLNQFLAEHDSTNQFIAVKAGAGSGKTFVMENRLMFLAHTKPNFAFDKVVMITFTNRATDSMRKKLVELLEKKFRLTSNIKYLDWVEFIPEITISTIHSFFRNVILEVGPLMGYGNNLKMSSMVGEKRKILKDILNQQYGSSKERVEEKLGLKEYELEGLATQFWKKIENNGLSEMDVSDMDWGTADSVKAQTIQNTLTSFFSKVGDVYDSRKRESNTIAMSDIIHEFGRVVTDTRIKDYITSKYDYVFCDEFQDSDDIQIQTLVVLDAIYDGNLFVVGDIKQSIYRFRGATDSAFERLEDNIHSVFGGDKAIKEYSLTKNYRTSGDILTQIDGIFRKWGDKDYLKYRYKGKENDVLTTQKEIKGIYKQIRVWNGDDRKEKVLSVTKKIRERISSELIGDENRKKTIMFLTRTNSELRKIKAWFEEKGIACAIRERGVFYNSDAVLDFYRLVSALLYYDEASNLFNLLNSSYFYHKVDEGKVLDSNGSNFRLVSYFLQLLNEKYDWKKSVAELVTKPVMEVIREIVDQRKPTNTYGSIMQQKYRLLGYSDEEAHKQTLFDMRQYDADLQKLLQLISDEFSNDFTTLYDIKKYLEIKINTDTEEDHAEIPTEFSCDIIMGSTVHGSKGLEFDYVLIPFMNDRFGQDFRSELLVDKKNNRVGWRYKSDSEAEGICNRYFSSLRDLEKKEVIADETRLLYVAMTRAIEGLFCFTDKRYSGEASAWSDLLPEEIDDANCI